MGIFDRAKNGVVLLSFGAYVDKKSLKPALRRAILDAFYRFPDYEFIWKLDGELDDIQDKYPNVHTMSWINQVSILG